MLVVTLLLYGRHEHEMTYLHCVEIVVEEHVNGQSRVLIKKDVINGDEKSFKRVGSKFHSSIIVHTTVLLGPRSEGQFGNNAEVVTGTSHTPEEVGVLSRRSFDDRTVP